MGEDQKRSEEMIDWLRARLDEDELNARDAVEHLLEGGETGFDWYALPEPVRHYLSTWVPKRVFAEVEAKRRILDEHAPDRSGYCPTCCDNTVPVLCATVMFLAAGYSDRPGYREEWR